LSSLSVLLGVASRSIEEPDFSSLTLSISPSQRRDRTWRQGTSMNGVKERQFIIGARPSKSVERNRGRGGKEKKSERCVGLERIMNEKGREQVTNECMHACK